MRMSILMNMRRLLSLCGVLALISLVNAAPPETLGERIVVAARSQIGITKEYDPKYTALKYPGGDVPIRKGVCTDVVVRALRKIGIDLQKEVHEDMLRSFSKYPQNWGLKKPDKNIDHRRVPNLMRYFERHHISLKPANGFERTCVAGDVIAWDLGNGILHVGVVSDRKAGGVPLIIHNIGSGAQEEDILLKYKSIGHYRVSN